MKVNFNVTATDFCGKPLMMFGKEVDLAEELSKSMFFVGSNGDNVSPEDKYLAYKIGQKLANGDTTYTTEELTFIKNTAAKTLAAGVYGQVVDIIEGGKE